MLPWLRSAVTIMRAPGARGVEPRVAATVTSTAGVAVAVRRARCTIQLCMVARSGGRVRGRGGGLRTDGIDRVEDGLGRGGRAQWRGGAPVADRGDGVAGPIGRAQGRER